MLKKKDKPQILEQSKIRAAQTISLLVAQMVKASIYNTGDPGSIPGREDPLEKEMTTHFSTLAWKIPWMEEPGRLQSMGPQRVGHD